MVRIISLMCLNLLLVAAFSLPTNPLVDDGTVAAPRRGKLSHYRETATDDAGIVPPKAKKRTVSEAPENIAVATLPEEKTAVTDPVETTAAVAEPVGTTAAVAEPVETTTTVPEPVETTTAVSERVENTTVVVVSPPTEEKSAVAENVTCTIPGAVKADATVGAESEPSHFRELMHPAKTIAAAYEASRHRVQEWMEEPRSTSYLMPALVGGFSAVLVIAIFYILRGMVGGCRSRRRRFRITKITEQLGDGKKLIDHKPDDSDNDII